MTQSESQARIKRLVVQSLEEHMKRSGRERRDLTDDLDVLHSGIIDSLAFIDLLLKVEAELGTSLALDQLDFDRVSNLKDLVEALDRLTGVS